MKTTSLALLIVSLFAVGSEAFASPDSEKKQQCQQVRQLVAREAQNSTHFVVVDLNLVCGACKFPDTGRIGRCFAARGNPCIRCRICDLQ